MPFPKVDIKDQVRYAAYHEATHVFFSMYYGFGISGGVEVYSNGLGWSGCRGIDIFDPNAQYYHYQHTAHVSLAPLVVEPILAGKPELVPTGLNAQYEAADWPCRVYPCEEFDLSIFVGEFGDDLRKGVAPLMVCALKNVSQDVLLDECCHYEDALENLKDDFDLEIETIKKKLSEEAYINAIGDLAEQAYVKRNLSKDDVLNILKPHFEGFSMPFKTD